MQKNQAEEHFRQSKQLVQRPYSRKDLGKFEKQNAGHKVGSMNGERRKRAGEGQRREMPAPAERRKGEMYAFVLTMTGGL